LFDIRIRIQFIAAEVDDSPDGGLSNRTQYRVPEKRILPGT